MAMPKLRFKEFDGNWKNYKLEDISNIKTGPFGSNLHKEDYVAVGTPIITVEHLGEISLTTQNLPLVSDTDKLRLSAYSLQEGDIAFSRVGSVDRCAIVTKQEKGWLFSGRILRVRPNNKIVFSKHLMYALKTEHSKHQIRSAAVGQTMPSLNTKILKEFIVCLSNSLEEQTKIATFLSAVDTKIDELTQKHKLLCEYKKGMMQQLFNQKLRFKADDGSDFKDWEERILGNICTTFSGGTPTSSNPAFYEGSIPFIKSGEIAQESTAQFINKSALDNSSAKLVEKGDLLYALYGATSGQVAISQISGAINQAVLCIRSETLDTNYLHNYLVFRKQKIISTYLQGGQGNLSASILKKISIPTPSFKEQTKIANFLTAIDQKIDNVAEQIDHAKTWKKGLLQQMFV